MNTKAEMDLMRQKIMAGLGVSEDMLNLLREVHELLRMLEEGGMIPPVSSTTEE